MNTTTNDAICELMSNVASLTAERDALRAKLSQQTARAERLRVALELLLKCNALGVAIPWGRAVSALAETPPQSLGKLRAGALREAANLIRQTTPDARSNSNVERGKFEGRMYAIKQLESEAERMEKEAANG